MAIAADFKMIFSNATRGSTHLTPRVRKPTNDLAERFLELQRLRRKVYELERLAMNDRLPPQPNNGAAMTAEHA
jgi:hypothetical protein